MMSAVQPNSIPLLTSSHIVSTTSAPHSTRQTEPSPVITASSILAQRPQNTAALANKWHQPVFSSMPTKLDRHPAQSRTLPVMGPLSTEHPANRHSPVAAAFDLSAAAEYHVNMPAVDLTVPTAVALGTPSVDLNVPTDVASGFMRAARPQPPPVSANLTRREKAQPDPYQRQSREPSRAPALYRPVAEPAGRTSADMTGLRVTSVPAKSVTAIATPGHEIATTAKAIATPSKAIATPAKAVATPAKVTATPAKALPVKAATANMTPAKAAATQKVVAGSSEKKKGSVGKKRKLLAPSLGVKSLFDTFPAAQEPMQEQCKGDSTAQQPTAGVDCPLFFVSA